MINSILILIILIILSGFFSGVEVAMMSVSDIRLNYLVDKNISYSKTLKKLKSNKERMLITILLGNNIVNIAASAQATSMALQYFANYGVAIATGIMTFVLLMFGEITPKSYAVNHSEKIALLSSPIVLFLSKLLYPFVKFFEYFIKLISPIINKGKINQKIITEDEIKNIISISEEDGAIKPLEREMIHNIFKFDDLIVKQIMLPRPNIFALDGTKKVKDVIKSIKRNGFSRVPVYIGKFDNIKGVLYTKDLIDVDKEKSLIELAHDVYVVPETKKIDILFKEMKSRRQHIAVVVDEFGVISGVITIEDLLEEIVGEIYDETDDPESHIKKQSDNVFIVSGDAEMRSIRKSLNLRLGTDENQTLSAYILKKIGKIPKTREKIVISKKTLMQILRVENNRIMKVKITTGQRSPK